MFDSFKTRQRISDVEEAVETIRRQLKGLEIEWVNTLDKLKGMVGRIAKDRERAERAREQDGSPVAGEGAGEGGQPLSSRQQEINSRILARRNRMAQ